MLSINSYFTLLLLLEPNAAETTEANKWNGYLHQQRQLWALVDAVYVHVVIN